MAQLFSEDDRAFVAEMLRLASHELQATATSLDARFPGARMAEQLRQWAERADDMRTRLDARD